MDLSKPTTSDKFERKISIALLKKSKIRKQYEFGGIPQRSVSMRFEALKLRLVLDKFSEYSFRLDHCNMNNLISELISKTEKLKDSYHEISHLEAYLEKPFTPHDVHRAIAAMDYQQDRLREVQGFLAAAKAHGKSPIQALTEMSPELFRKEAPSDRWQGGGRLACKNPLDDIAVVIRPTEVRIARKFFEALVENIYTLDNSIAEAMPVIDYGLAIFEQNLINQKCLQAEEVPANAMQIEALAPSVQHVQENNSPHQLGFSEISQRDLDRNIHHISGYLKSMYEYYTPEQLIDRRDVLLEDIFQIIKCRVALSSAQHDLDEAELREVFKQSIVKGLEVFKGKFNGGITSEKINNLIERTQTEELTVTAKPEPERLTDDDLGALQAYARAMNY